MSLKIPMDRVGVLIGKKGEVKQRIESITDTEIEVDSASGSVFIKKKNPDTPMIGDWIAKNIVKAIARGFNPKIAEKLIDEEYLLEILDVEALVGRSRKRVRRIKSRIIGESGKTKKTIESLAGVHISIYGDTVAIIGMYEELRIAREAIKRLIAGQNHSTVYRYLQRKHDELKRKSLTELWKPRDY